LKNSPNPPQTPAMIRFSFDLKSMLSFFFSISLF